MNAVLRVCLVLACAVTTLGCAEGPTASRRDPAPSVDRKRTDTGSFGSAIGVCREDEEPKPEIAPPPCDEPATPERLSRR